MIELSMTSGSGNASTHYQQSAQVGYAGDSLNTAIYLQRSIETMQAQNTHSVSYITAVGLDSFSDQIMSLIANENIDTSLVQRSNDRTPGLYAINTDAAGERSFSYWRDQSAAKTLFSAETGPELNQLLDFDLIYYSAISLAILPDSIKQQWLDFLEKYRKQEGKQVAFDSNYRPRLWNSVAHAQEFTKAAFKHCDIALPSMDDEMALFGDANREAVIERLSTYGVNRGVLKCGALGPVDLADTSTQYQLEEAKLVVDSTAAGDSYNGAFLASLALNKPVAQCIADGHACAMKVIGFPGAIVERSLWG